MDQIQIHIFEDGTMEIKTNEVSTGNHMSADKLMASFDELMGGHVHIEKNPDAHHHVHSHNHAHVGHH